MPIEFRCSQCAKLLRTPDGTSGRQAKCPECGTLSTIPAASEVVAEEAAAALPPPRAAIGSDNPFQPPVVEQTLAPAPEARRGFHPTRIELGDVLGRAWRIFKDNLAKCVLANILIVLITYSLFIIVAIATRDQTPAVQQLVNLPVNVFSFWLTLGALVFFLNVARGAPAAYSDLFSGSPFFWPAVGASLLFSLALFIGFVLLIIPFFIVMLTFWPVLLILIDQRVGVLDSFRMAREATRGNKLTVLALGLLMMCLWPLIVLVTCGFGFFLVQPFMTLLFAVTYLGITGQGTAAETIARPEGRSA